MHIRHSNPHVTYSRVSLWTNNAGLVPVLWWDFGMSLEQRDQLWHDTLNESALLFHWHIHTVSYAFNVISVQWFFSTYRQCKKKKTLKIQTSQGLWGAVGMAWKGCVYGMCVWGRFPSGPKEKVWLYQWEVVSLNLEVAIAIRGLESKIQNWLCCLGGRDGFTVSSVILSNTNQSLTFGAHVPEDGS